MSHEITAVREHEKCFNSSVSEFVYLKIANVYVYVLRVKIKNPTPTYEFSQVYNKWVLTVAQVIAAILWKPTFAGMCIYIKKTTF